MNPVTPGVGLPGNLSGGDAYSRSDAGAGSGNRFGDWNVGGDPGPDWEQIALIAGAVLIAIVWLKS